MLKLTVKVTRVEEHEFNLEHIYEDVVGYMRRVSIDTIGELDNAIHSGDTSFFDRREWYRGELWIHMDTLLDILAQKKFIHDTYPTTLQELDYAEGEEFQLLSLEDEFQALSVSDLETMFGREIPILTFEEALEEAEKEREERAEEWRQIEARS